MPEASAGPSRSVTVTGSIHNPDCSITLLFTVLAGAIAIAGAPAVAAIMM